MCAKAEFFELTGKYDDAFEWYAKVQERYDDSQPLIDFCNRFKEKTGDHRFDAALKSQAGKIFPDGIEKVSLKDFKSAPDNGVLVQTESDLLHAAGMKAGDVIVALNGVRIHAFDQYVFERDTSAMPEMTLIVWQGNQYHEIKASPPNHRFDADMGDYSAK